MRHSNTKKSGFTLIELLVVISIIGLLASIVLASLQNARKRGERSAIVSDLVTVRTQAALWFSNHGSSYGPPFAMNQACPTSGSSMFATDSTMKAALQAANNYVKSTPPITSTECASNGTKYVVIVRYSWTSSPSSSIEYCIDDSNYIYSSKGHYSADSRSHGTEYECIYQNDIDYFFAISNQVTPP